MKKVSVKALMIVSLFLAAMLYMPIMALGQDDDDDDDSSDEQVGMYEGFTGGFGGVFGKNMGFGGQVFELIFESLLLQSLDLDAQEELEGVYVLSASNEETFNGTYKFKPDDEDDHPDESEEIHILPWIEEDGQPGNDYDRTGLDGYQYCKVEKTGGYEYNLTVGAGVTIIIWDYDKSFITAAKKVLSWAEKMHEDTDGGKDDPSPEIIQEGLSVLSWLLIHINEIFTGDELFVLNPFTWQQLQLTPLPGTAITKTWYQTDSDYIIDSDDDLVDTIQSGRVSDWNDTANHASVKDSYMQWLCRNFTIDDLVETWWTQFSFDIFQLWVKNFHIEIDVAEFMKGAQGEDVNVADAFQGCDIEFFIFTHHLAGAFLYDDHDLNDQITVKYDRVRNDSITDENDPNYYIKNEDGSFATLPNSTEVTHRLILGEVGEFDFDDPEVDEKKDTVEWGLTLKDAYIKPVPVGIDLNSYLGTPQEDIEYLYFGCKFIPEVEDELNDDGQIEASGKVKLEHNFGNWSGDDTLNNISDLDLSIIYVSSIFHFHLQIDTENDDTDPDDDWDYDDEEDYSNNSAQVKVGNYLDEDASDKLDFIDLAGETYTLGDDSNGDGKPDKNVIEGLQATTTTVPVALWTGEHESHETHHGEEDTQADDFESDVRVEADWSIMLYAVNYPDWNGSRLGIYHDPTFSVYMAYTPAGAGFWALILLIAGIGLVGVATILIKRRKDKRF